MLTSMLTQLTSTCQIQISRLLDEFEAAPSRGTFFDIGAVAEVLVLNDTNPDLAPLVRPVAHAAAGWLQSGLLEDICFSRVEFVYHTALLAYLARQSERFAPGDMNVLSRLCQGRLVGRSELPVLGQSVIAAYFSRCGIAMDFGDLGRRNLTRMIDKRVLRARSDEYDILTFLMCAQLFHLNAHNGQAPPRLYPHVLLVDAMRSGNMNWFAVLTFLCAGWFGLPEHLRSVVWSTAIQHFPERGYLLPLPNRSGTASDFIERGGGRGLRIRSSVALLSLLHTLGDSHANARTCLAIC